MLTGNLPRKSSEGRFNMRHRSAVRHHGDHEIEAKFIAPMRKQGLIEAGAVPMVVWKIRQKHGNVLPPEVRRRSTRKMLAKAVS